MTSDIKREPWNQLGFRSETDYRNHFTKQNRMAKERGFVPYTEYQKHSAEDKMNKLIQELEELAESCNIQLPYKVPISIRYLNKIVYNGHIDKNTYDTIVKRVKLSTDKFKKKCNCNGTRKVSIRETHPEEIMTRLKLLKESVESCITDAPSMAFMANKSLGMHTGYAYKDPSRVTKGLREILNIADEFKGCSCKR